VELATIPESVARGSGLRRQPAFVSWAFLFSFLLLTGIAQGAYAASEQEPSGRFQLLTKVGFVVILWQWFTRQLTAQRVHWSLDAGVLITLFWLILMPYFLWRYERWRGLLKISAVVVFHVVSHGAGILVWLLLRRPG
jgi:hypothetical protein